MTDWSQIVKQHGPIVWKSVYRLLDNEADAADCFQNTFVSALELSRTQSVRNWPGLLKRLATARALERLRQRYRESSRVTTLADAPVEDRKAIDPKDNAEAAELAQELRDALANLDARHAEVFCLACLDGFSYQKISDELGLTVNHVGVLLTRARSSLRERLESKGLLTTPDRSKRENQA